MPKLLYKPTINCKPKETYYFVFLESGEAKESLGTQAVILLIVLIYFAVKLIWRCCKKVSRKKAERESNIKPYIA